MAGDNDFFVKFDSNAAAWGADLARQLKPARDQIAALESALDGLDQRAKGVGKNTRRLLAMQTPGTGGAPTTTPGGGGGGGSRMTSQGGLDLARINDALDETVSSQQAITQSLAASIKLIDAIPERLSRGLNSLTSSLNRIVENAEGRGRAVNPQSPGNRFQPTGTPGTQPIGSDQQRFWQDMRERFRSSNNQPSILDAPALARIRESMAIPKVPSAAIDRAGIDRIVVAIRAQTRVIAAGMRAGVNVAGVTEVSDGRRSSKKGGKKSSRAAAAAVEEAAELPDSQDELTKAAARLNQIDGKIAQIFDALGGQSNDVADATIAELRTMRAQVAAEANKLEREATGISRGGQREQRQKDAAAERRARPNITEDELNDRRRRAALVASPADPGFLAQVGGRGGRIITDENGNRRRDRYNMGDLRGMADEFTRLGQPVQYSTRTKQDDLANRLVEAARLLREAFPKGHPDLQTRGVNVERPTRVSDDLTEMLGVITPAEAAQARRDRELASANMRGGGSGELHRGRENFGAGVLGPEVPLPFVRAGTPDEVLQSRQRLVGNGQLGEIDRVLSRINRPGGFNPFDSGLRKQITSGNTPEEKSVARAYGDRLRDTRLTTREIDRMGQAFLKLQERLVETGGFLSRALGRQGTDREKPTDQANIESSREQFARIQKTMQFLEQGGQYSEQFKAAGVESLRPTFTDPRFRQGVEERRSDSDAYSQRRQNMIDTVPTLSDYMLVRTGTADAAVGLGTVAGSKQMAKQVPGMTAFGGKLDSENGLSAANKRELNAGLNKATKAQTDMFAAQLDLRRVKANLGTNVPDKAQAAEIDAMERAVKESEAAFEQAANTMLNKMASLFNGIAPAIDKFGVTPRDPKVIADETRRRESREQAEADRTRKAPRKTTQEKLADLEGRRDRASQAILDADKALVASKKREAAIAEKIAKDAEARRAALSAEQLVELEALERTAREQDKIARRLERETPTVPLNRKKDRDKLGGFTQDSLGYDARLGYGESQYRDAYLPKAGPQPFGPLPQGVDRSSRNDDLEAAQAKAERAERRANKILSPEDGEDLSKARRESARQVAAAKVAADRFAEAAEQAKNLAANIERVRELAAAGANRKSIKEQTGLSPTLISDVLGPARPRKPAGPDSIEAAVDQISAAAGVEPKRRKGATVSAATSSSPEARVTATLTAAQQKRLAMLKQEQSVLQGTPFRQTDERLKSRKGISAALKGGDIDQETADEARAIAKRLRELHRQIDKIQAGGGGSRGGGGGGRTATGGASGGSGGDNNYLRQILARLTQIHGVLKGGIKVTSSGSRGPSIDPATGEPRVRPTRSRNALNPELQASRSDDDAEILKAVQKQRQRLERLRPSQFDPSGGINAEGKRYATGTSVDAAYEENARRNRTQSRTSSADDAATRAAIRDAERLASALSGLSTPTKAEIEKLNQLAAASRQAGTAEERLARQRALTAQQTRVARLIDGEMRIGGAGATERSGATRTVLQAASPEITVPEVQDVQRMARSGAEAAQEFQTGFAGVFGRSGFWSRVISSTGTFVVRNFTAGFVFGLTAALQDIIGQAIQTEATFIRVSAALEATGRAAGNVRGDLQAISTDYGVALNDVYQTAAGLSGLFDNAADLAAGTRVANQLQTISGGALNASEATGVLASTLSAFEAGVGDDIKSGKFLDPGVQGMQHVADVLTNIQNNLGVNIETTAEGVASLAGLARQMSLSFEETAVFSATIAKQTNQTGAAAGEQFSRILGSLQTGRGRGAVTKAFKDSGQGDPFVSTSDGEGNQVTDYGESLKNMLRGWDNLSDAQKRNIQVAVAGQRQARAFGALTNDTQKTLNNLAKAEDANGDAAERMERLMASLNKRLDVLQTNAQNLASNLLRTGLLNFLGLVLLATNSVLGAINKLLSAFNDLADSNGVLGFLRSAVTLLLGAGLAIKLVQTGVAGLRGALRGSDVAQNARQGIQERQQQRQRTVGGPDRPRFGEYGTPGRAPVARAVGFGLDRSVGVGLDATGRGLQGLGNRLLDSERQTGRFGTGVGNVARRLGTYTSFISAATRDAFQNMGAGGRGIGNRLGDAGSSRLRAAADRYAERAAENRQLYSRQQDQERYRQQGATPAQQRRSLGRLGIVGAGAEAAMQRPQTGLRNSARALDGLSRIANGAATGVSRAGAALSALNRTGALTDAAMLGVTLAITGLISSVQRRSEQARQERDDYESDYGKDAGKSEGEIAEQYRGKTSETVDQARKKTESQNRLSLGFGAVFDAFTDTSQFSLKKPAFGIDPFGAFRRSKGLSSTKVNGRDETQGLTVANDFLAEGQKELDGAKTSDDIRKVQEDQAKRVKEMVDKIHKNKDLSAAQKSQAEANLQEAQGQLSDQASNLESLAQGIGSAIALTADQVKQVQENAAASQSIAGVGQLGNGNVDISGIMRSIREDEGFEEGSKPDRILQKMASGNLDNVDVGVANLRLMRDGINALQIQMEEKLRNNLPDEAEEIRGQSISAISAYGQATDSAVSAIIDQANLISGQLNAEGSFGDASKQWNQAMRRAQRIFNREGGDVLAALAASKSAASGLADATPRGLGNALEARNPIPVPKKADVSKARAQRQTLVSGVTQQIQTVIQNQTRELRVRSSKTKNPKAKAFIDQKIAQITAGILNSVNQGLPVPGIDADTAKNFGNAAVDAEQLAQAEIDANQQHLAYQSAEKSAASTAAQNAASIAQAQAGVASAYADARGDAVAGARAQQQAARAAIQAARAEMAIATTPEEVASARVALLNAQASMISANAALSDAQSDLVQSRYEVSIALAEAAGNSVLAATKTLQAARAAVGAALKASGGKATAEVNRARAQAIQAEASLRDARLQDQLDTIDFNLQMGKITQASAISALKQILKTSDLTKQQRRQLLLQIKGMNDEIADSQFNFGNIKLPTPYQMRRYAQEQLGAANMNTVQAQQNQLNQTLGASPRAGATPNGNSATSTSTSTTHQTTIQINGADVAKVRKIVEDVVGRPSRTTTTAPRRRV